MSAPLVRAVLRVDATTTAPLDELARVTGLVLVREVSRSAVVRAAVIDRDGGTELRAFLGRSRPAKPSGVCGG